MTDYFVGRKSELDTFKSCLGTAQNGVYYYGDGGIGKTQLLKRIISLSKKELGLKTSSLIDFFSTRNHSVEGLQNTIMEQIDAPQHFQEIAELRQQLQAAQSQSPHTLPGLAASLQRRIEVLFSSCCNEAAKDTPIVLVFDSFEYVQERDVGHWLLRDFLPTLEPSHHNGLIIVLAGRPKPLPADTPVSIMKHPLSGLGQQDVIDYVERIGLSWREDLMSLYLGTQGNPLLIELIRWRGRPELMRNRQKLEAIIGNPEIMAREIFDEVAKPTPLNRVLWAMATLKRRFDFTMLKYLVNTMRWIGKGADYDTIRKSLHTLPFVKSGENGTSHLLHDEAIEPIAIVFNGITGLASLKDELFEHIVQGYYPEQIKSTKSQSEQAYLRVEQFGYILDRDWDKGLALFRAYREDVKQRSDYDFEELLWGEFYEYLVDQQRNGKLSNEAVNLMLERSGWLFANGLHSKREHLARLIYQLPYIETEKRMDASMALGFALMRQGKLNEAEKYQRKALGMAQQLKSDTWIAVAENNLGQLMAMIGRHDEAVELYWNSLKSYRSFDNPDRIAAVYSARGASLAMIGQYDRALEHCFYALRILDKYPHALRKVHALRNIGKVYQLTGNYQASISHLSKALRITEEENFFELKAEILHDLSRSSHLHGRHAREENQNFSVACSNQSRAINALLTSLEKARYLYHRPIISRGLIQFAHIIEEITRLNVIANAESVSYSDDSTNVSIPMLQVLISQAQTTQIPEDIYWLQRGLEHFPQQHFTDLTLKQKVVRLFELGVLEAAAASQFNLEIEGWAELARVLLELHLFEEVEKAIGRIKQIRPGVHDDRTLLALGTLVQADLAFDRGDMNGALLRYAQGVPSLANARGYVVELINTRIDELFKRIRSMTNTNTAIEWCESLQAAWIDAYVGDTMPTVVERIQMLLHELHEALR